MEQNGIYGFAGVGGTSGPQVRRSFSELAYGALIFVRWKPPCLYLSKPEQQPLACSECRVSFSRQQEQDRHFQSFHLPCWIFCPYPGCRWRGDRVDEFQRHLTTRKCGPRPAREQQFQIYNVKMVMNWIKESQGDFISTAQDFAMDLVKERALELGRQEWVDDPWGRPERRNFVSNV